MKNAQKFSVLIWADKRKTDAQGMVPLYARITYLSKRAEISLGRKVDPPKWDAETGYVRGNGSEVRDINTQIIEAINEIRRAFDDLKRTEDFITAEKIKQKYTGEGANHRMLLEVFDEHNNQLEKLLDKDFVRATLTKYKTVRKKTAAYIQWRYKKPDIYLESIDYGFVTGLEMYLKTEDKIEHNTAMRYIKNLKKIINLAVNNQWMSHNPFNLFKCTYNKVNRLELEWEEINALAAYNFKVKRLAEVRDTFLFCCYTGYAFVDVDKLTPQHVITGADGVTGVKTTRTKTAIESNVPLIPQAIEIIERYAEHDARIIENRLLPVKSNQKMNAYLKEIGDLAGIEKVLTTHIARHTFATTVTLENDVPLETVSKMLGHAKFATTQIYAKMKDKKVNRDMQALKERLEANRAGQKLKEELV
ncbi:site-specific integrase [Mucilaginibacter sp. cycad4]|uniref:site-specific integrase n=1 Tax=Mucilaginibacter sp. cycad4 TaxID=3342096 RepID=UPI002AABC7D0|nr:site-specific integrase [Mucilaginibacter gossypii]WPU98449.1 site-specific integrase [Mucilaginibacter gossypii]